MFVAIQGGIFSKMGSIRWFAVEMTRRELWGEVPILAISSVPNGEHFTDFSIPDFIQQVNGFWPLRRTHG